MKVLLYDDTPAYLTHGGKQVLAQKLHDGLRALGVDVDYARWWDPAQKCDLLHLFSLSPAMVWAARQAGVKVILTQIVDRLANLSESKRFYRQVLGYGIRNFLPSSVFRRFSWSVLSELDALVYVHKYDAEAAVRIYGAPRAKTAIIPHGCDVEQLSLLQAGVRNRHSYLISIGSIVPRKNSVLLAKAARRAEIPVVFLGKPFSEASSYYKEFCQLVDNKNVVYAGHVSEQAKIRWLTEASGFVLLSGAESGCIAAYEAAAARLPMLLSNLPWAHAYGENIAVQYVDLRSEERLAARLKSFFATSQRLEGMTFPVMTWEDIAGQYLDVYKRVLGVGPSDG